MIIINRDLVYDGTYSSPPPPPPGKDPSYRLVNEDIILSDMLNRLCLRREDLIHMTPDELKARIRDNKLNSIL